jgi:hypothetical protein
MSYVGQVPAEPTLGRVTPEVAEASQELLSRIQCAPAWQHTKRVFGGDHMQAGLAQPRQPTACRWRVRQFSQQPLRHGQRTQLQARCNVVRDFRRLLPDAGCTETRLMALPWSR